MLDNLHTGGSVRIGDIWVFCQGCTGSRYEKSTVAQSSSSDISTDANGLASCGDSTDGADPGGGVSLHVGSSESQSASVTNGNAAPRILDPNHLGSTTVSTVDPRISCNSLSISSSWGSPSPNSNDCCSHPCPLCCSSCCSCRTAFCRCHCGCRAGLCDCRFCPSRSSDAPLRCSCAGCCSGRPAASAL
jgi:hypothetical protein